MTAIDISIIAFAIYGVWRCRAFILDARASGSPAGVWLLALGLLIVSLFYFADLVSMHVLPTITSAQRASALMDALHRNLSWPVLLLAVIVISIGFVKLLVELQERETRAQRLIDSNIIGVFTWDPDGRIIDANEAFLRVVGYSRRDLVSGRLSWRELTPAEWHDADERRAAELRATGSAQPYEKEYFRKSGSRVPVLVGATTFAERAKRPEGVAFVLDLTERKKAEMAVRETERRYREVLTELAHANRVATMGHLSASITHEISQPITAAVTSAHAALRWLSDQPSDLEKARRALGRIVENGGRVRDVIDRIRALFKKTDRREDILDINEAILEVLGLVHAEVVKNDIFLQTQFAKELPAVQGDRVQVQQVILNLLMNAVEAMSGSGVEPRELVINTGTAVPDGVLVTIRDSGPGFSTESVERLFEAFYTTKPNGLGMGLSVCRSIIESHQGRLWASGNAPHGAIFQFILPGHADGSHARAA